MQSRRARVPRQQDSQHQHADDHAGGEELLPAPQREGRVPLISAQLRVSLP